MLINMHDRSWLSETIAEIAFWYITNIYTDNNTKTEDNNINFINNIVDVTDTKLYKNIRKCLLNREHIVFHIRESSKL